MRAGAVSRLLAFGLDGLIVNLVFSGLAAIAVASMPLFAGVFAMLRGRHPSRMEWVGLIIGFIQQISDNRIGATWTPVGSESDLSSPRSSASAA